MSVDEVREALFARPWAFSFFQAVRLLHRFEKHRSPLGSFGMPRNEVVRLGVPTSIAFPASELQGLQGGGSGAAEMSVNVLGLIGPQGVLPYWYSVVVDEAARGRNHAARAFLDIFQHRMLSHFYRAWEKSRPEVAFERGGTDALEPILRAVVGVGSAGLENRLPIPDSSLFFYSGLLGPTQRSAIGLEQMLVDYFSCPVLVEQFSGGWFTLAPEALLRLGDEGSAASQLGVGSVLGDAIWNEQAKVRIRVGPLAREDFEAFLPPGRAFAELQHLVRFWADESVEFELQLLLDPDAVQPTVLGHRESLPLGWGSWMPTRTGSVPLDEVVFSL